MKQFRLSWIIAVVFFLFLSGVAYPAAFQFYELGTPIIGTADVGQAAIANDASTSYFNPAGMVKLGASQGMLGSQLIMPHIAFSRYDTTTIKGDNGGNAAVLAPGMGIYYVYHYSQQLKLGFSFTEPYGGALNYNDHWVGRYNIQQMMFYTLNLNPSLGYQVNNWLALGAGFAVEYANLNQSVSLPILGKSLDGQSTVKASDFSPGYNLGLLLTPYNTTKIGVAFRSQIIHNMQGKVDFLNLDITPQASTRMVMPSNVIASLSQALTNQLILLGEAGWSNWSSMKNTAVNIAGFTATVPQNWHDTYRVGFGGQYYYLPSLMIQGGVSYDSSPTSSSHRLPELPMDRQIRIGTGIEYLVIRAVTLGLSYEYINFGNAKINNMSSNGLLSGKYPQNFANVLQVSLNVSC